MHGNCFSGIAQIIILVFNSNWTCFSFFGEAKIFILNLEGVLSVLSSNPSLTLSIRQSGNGDTPLHIAARYGSKDVLWYLKLVSFHQSLLLSKFVYKCSALIDRGADPQANNLLDRTPLQVISKREYRAYLPHINQYSLHFVDRKGLQAICMREGFEFISNPLIRN